MTTKPELGTGAVYRRLARNSAWLAGGTGSSALFMMFAVLLCARALSAREFGQLVILQSATLMIGSLMSFGTQQPVIKLGFSAQAEGDLSHLGRIIGLGLKIDALAALAACALAFAFLAVGHGRIGLPGSELGIALPFAASLLFTGYLTSNGLFRLLNRFDLLGLIQAGCAAAILAACACLFIFRASFQAYCWAWAIFYVLNGQIPLIIGATLARRAGIPISFSMAHMRPGEIRTFLAYCWTTWGTATTEALRSNGDSLLVGALVSVEAAGIYNVAKQLAGVLRKLNTVYASAAFPEIAALSAHGEHESAGRVRRRMLWAGAFIGAAALGAALLLGHLLLALFGPQFAAGYAPLAILTAAAAAQLISHTLSMYVQVYVGPEHVFYAYLAATLLFLLIVVPLTLLLAVSGTAIAQLLFTLALIILCHLALRRAPSAA